MSLVIMNQVNKKLDEEYTNLLDLNLAVIELLTSYRGKEVSSIYFTNYVHNITVHIFY